MRAAEAEIRACVSLFKKELTQLVEQAMREEVADALEAAVEAERAEMQAEAERARQQQTSALEDDGFTFKLDVDNVKAELQQLGLVDSDADPAKGGGSQQHNGNRRRRSGNSMIASHLEQEPSALGLSGSKEQAAEEPPAPPPPPLFVHKRRRDGQIQSLTRATTA